MNADIELLQEILRRARAEVAKVVIGQAEAVDRALIVIFTGHHALVEGVPGVAKTLLVKTLARVLGGPFARIQFTPDLMPADITGTRVFNLRDQTFTLAPGPVFTAFLLGDEINRAPAKTQAALLQAMQERSVTIDLETHALPAAFTVFATQNPIEFEGTYPLPEAQKDRFMLKIAMDCPSREEELDLARRMLGEEAPERRLERGDVETVIGTDDLTRLRRVLRDITVGEELVAYVTDLVRKTRTHESILVGAGPRATQALLLAGRAAAALQGRDFVTPDDIKGLARPVFEHRIVLRPEFEVEGVTVGEAIGQVLEGVAVPR